MKSTAKTKDPTDEFRKSKAGDIKRGNNGRLTEGRIKTKANVDRILKNLLAQKSDLDQWHSPKGIHVRKQACFKMRSTYEELIVMHHVAKEMGVTMSQFVRKMVIREYYKKSGYMEHISVKVGPKIMRYMFEFASNRIKGRPTRKPPKI